jgi:hypothetical protein
MIQADIWPHFVELCFPIVPTAGAFDKTSLRNSEVSGALIAINVSVVISSVGTSAKDGSPSRNILFSDHGVNETHYPMEIRSSKFCLCPPGEPPSS